MNRQHITSSAHIGWNECHAQYGTSAADVVTQTTCTLNIRTCKRQPTIMRTYLIYMIRQTNK
jgi:hypothetical protein